MSRRRARRDGHPPRRAPRNGRRRPKSSSSAPASRSSAPASWSSSSAPADVPNSSTCATLAGGASEPIAGRSRCRVGAVGTGERRDSRDGTHADRRRAGCTRPAAEVIDDSAQRNRVRQKSWLQVGEELLGSRSSYINVQLYIEPVERRTVPLAASQHHSIDVVIVSSRGVHGIFVDVFRDVSHTLQGFAVTHGLPTSILQISILQIRRTRKRCVEPGQCGVHRGTGGGDTSC